MTSFWDQVTFPENRERVPLLIFRVAFGDAAGESAVFLSELPRVKVPPPV